MRVTAMPRAQSAYSREEEQVFRDLVRRGVELSATEEGLYLLTKRLDELEQRITNLPEFLNDADAGVGGLVEGQFYQTPTGDVKVKRP